MVLIIRLKNIVLSKKMSTCKCWLGKSTLWWLDKPWKSFKFRMKWKHKLKIASWCGYSNIVTELWKQRIYQTKHKATFCVMVSKFTTENLLIQGGGSPSKWKNHIVSSPAEQKGKQWKRVAFWSASLTLIPFDVFRVAQSFLFPINEPSGSRSALD